MKKIKLLGKIGKGKYTIIDNEDYKKVNKYKWNALRGRNTFYGQRSFYKKGKQKFICLHSEIMGKYPPKKEIDHIDGNGLNNQKSNLRFVTRSDNQKNRHFINLTNYTK